MGVPRNLPWCYNHLFPYNSKNLNKPLDYFMMVPDIPESAAFKKLCIGLLEIVLHAAGVKGLFSMMSAIKNKKSQLNFHNYLENDCSNQASSTSRQSITSQ